MFSLCLLSESALLAPLQLQLLFKVEKKKKKDLIGKVYYYYFLSFENGYLPPAASNSSFSLAGVPPLILSLQP